MVPFLFDVESSLEGHLSGGWLGYFEICNEVTYLAFVFRFIMSEFNVILDSPFSAEY